MTKCYRHNSILNPQQYLNQLFSYGVDALQKSDLLLAQKTFQQILKEFPDHPDAHNLLGVVLSKKGVHAKAVEHFSTAIKRNENNTGYYINRGLAYAKHNELQLAIEDFESVIKINPELADGYFNLGNILKQLDRVEEARKNFEKTVSLQPKHEQGLYNLGNLHLEIGNFKSAITFLERAININPKSAAAHNNLGIALQEWERWREAENHFKASLSLKPDFIDAAKNLAALYEKQGKIEEARVQLLHFVKSKRDAWQVMRAEMLCPIIPQSNNQIDNYRKKLNDILDHYLSQLPEGDPELIFKSAVEPPSMLIYQGRDDKALKQKFASLFAPYFPKPSERNHSMSSKHRVGFVVTGGHEGVFIKCMKGIIDHLSIEKFEVIVICSLPNGEKILRPRLNRNGLRFLSIPNNLNQAVKMIEQAEVDILHYWEVGTDSLNYFLPFYRLARVQCTSWGWPVTSGIPTIDYFLSSKNLEIENSESQYSEKLIKFDRLPSYYFRPPTPSTLPTRAYFGLPNDAHLYLCNQNLRKVHPDFDELVASILKKDKNGVALFIEDKQENITKLLKDRINSTSAEIGNRLRILKRMNEPDYLGLLGVVDVVLDTLHYTGGANTTYDAFSMGTPIVTLQGFTHRSRYTTAAYQQIGVTEGYADLREAYVEKALNLGTNYQARSAMGQFIKETSHGVFEDRVAITELEEFLRTC